MLYKIHFQVGINKLKVHKQYIVTKFIWYFEMTFEGQKGSFALLYKHYDLYGSEPCRGVGPRNGGGECHQNGRFVLFLQ